MNEALDIVVVDDNPDDLKWMSRLSKGLSTPCNVHTLATTDNFESVLSELSPSIVFVDHRLGEENGVSLIKQFHDNYPNSAFVLITGLGTEKLMSEAIRAGAIDFLRKEEIDAEVLDQLVERITDNILKHQYAKLALSVLNEGIITADQHHRIVRCNPAVEQIVGLSEADLKGVQIEDLFQPEDEEVIDSLFALANSQWDSQPRLQIKNNDNKNLFVTMIVNSVIAAREEIFIVILKQYYSDERTPSNIAKQLAIINNTSDFIGYANAEGEIQFMNPATKELFGINEVNDKKRYTLFNLFSSTMRRALASNIFPQLSQSGYYVGNGLIDDRNGKAIPVSIVMNGLLDGDNKLETITFLLRKITPHQNIKH